MKNKFTFETAPTIHAPRSVFDLSHPQTTTMSVGRLQPFLVQEVYPGDTFTIKETSIVKVTSNFIKPPTGNLTFETYYFFVPNRLVYDKWENVVASSDDPDGWEETEHDSVPMVGVKNIVSKSIADFMRIPVFANGNSDLRISSLPFRDFALIYNTWIRNQNVQTKVYVPKGDTVAYCNANPWGVNNIFGMCPNINKHHDLFTTCLPAPQKGEAIQVPFQIPQTLLDTVATSDSVRPMQFKSGKPLDFRWGHVGSSLEDRPAQDEVFIPYTTGYADDVPVASRQSALQGMLALSDGVNEYNDFVNNSGILAQGAFSLDDIHSPTVMGTNLVVPSINVTGFTIDDLYKAVALQKANYVLGISGSRYIELLRSIWNVDSPDARLQRPELLYGNITPINFQTVAQTTGSNTEDNSLANLSAYSNTLAKTHLYKGFVEHGFIIGVACIRQKHLYQQGIERFWFRSKYEDFYNPLFANWGEVNVHRAELYAQDTHDENGDLIPFGYQEAYYDLRQRQGAITGMANTYAEDSLDIWHFGDSYSNAPVLGEDFMKEVPNFVDRTLAVPSTSQDSFIVDTYFNISAIRRLPPRSIPGIQSIY